MSSLYDGFGRIVSSTTTRGGVAIAYAYQYDPDGNRTGLTNPDGAAFAYERDGLGRVGAIRHNGATLIGLGYDGMGRRTSLTRGDGSAATYQYDGASRLTRLRDELAGSGSDLTITLGYNPASQIVSRETDNDLYVWTGHGNGSTASPADGLSRTTALGGTALGYDPKGNLVFDGTRAFAYDSENRLRIPAAPYHYDPLGRLSGADNSPGTAPAIAYENYIDRLVAERTPGSPTVQRRHVFGPGTDEPPPQLARPRSAAAVRSLPGIAGELPDQPDDILAKLRRKAQPAEQERAGIVAERHAFASPPGQDVEQVDARRLEAGEIGGAKPAAVVLVEALLGNVGPDQSRELRLLEAEPFAFLPEPGAERHGPD